MGGNIRYYGADPNNYIDIGDVYEEDTTINNWEKYVGIGFFNQSSECYAYLDCTNYAELGFDDEASCTAGLPTRLEQEFGVSSVEEVCGTTTFSKGTIKTLYRIIGVFKDIELADGTKQDLVKVVRAESIGKYSWDTSDSSVNNGWGINEWSQADLMKLLNPGYESETVGGSLWWNGASGSCYIDQKNRTITYNFTGIGLSDNVKDKIASVVWNTGGWNSTSVYSDEIYTYERGTKVISNPSDGITRKIKWTGKVALPYPSDYGYAADFMQCNEELEYYDCTSANWMNSVLTGDSWLLTPTATHSYDAWKVNSSGYVTNGYTVSNAYGVGPVFYLNSELGIVSGTGTSSDPYRLSY